MTHRLINVALFIGLLAFFVLTLGWLGPYLDLADQSYEQEVAKEELAKQRQQSRFARAASEMCGNGGWSIDPEGAVVCRVRKALNARRVSL